MRLPEIRDVAFLAALHALCLKLFYRYTPDSCLEIDVKSVIFGSQAPGLNDTAIAEGRRRPASPLVRAAAAEPGDLWDALLDLRYRQPAGAFRALRRAEHQRGATSPGIGVRARSPTPIACGGCRPRCRRRPAGRQPSTTISAA